MNEVAILCALRFKQAKSKLRFWLTAIGYDTSDHSATNRLYLIYLVVFFSIWGLMVVALLSSVVAQYLFVKDSASFYLQAGSINLLIFLIWFAATAYTYLSHSPMLFSEEDALQICQTPLNRHVITSVEFLFDWPFKLVPFLFVGTVLSLSALDANLIGSFDKSMFGKYFWSFVRVVIVLTPFHFSLYCILWATGLARLQGKQRFAVPILIGASGLSAIGIFSSLAPMQTTIRDLINISFLWPIAFPVMAAFGAKNWLLGTMLSLLYSALSFFLLNKVGKTLNLADVNQASIYDRKRLLLLQAGHTHASIELAKQRYLGEERQPTTFTKKGGIALLIQKDFIQAFRYMTAQDLLGWLFIPLLFYFLIQFANQTTLWLILVYLIPAIAQKAIMRVSDDLKCWWMFHSLPLEPETILIGNLTGSYLLILFLLSISFWLNVLINNTPWIFSFFIPLAVAIIFLIAVVDMARQLNRESLLNGVVTGISGLSVMMGLFCLVVIFGVYWLTKTWILLAILSTLLISGLILVVLWKLSVWVLHSV
jgi:hypothetical protein